MSSAEIRELKKELSSIIRNTIRLEMMKIRTELIPYISDNEQKEIEELYDKPSRKVARQKRIRYDVAS